MDLAALVAEHRAIEAALDPLARGFEPQAFRRARDLVLRHYLREEALVPDFPAKLRGQHEEAREIAARLEESVAEGLTGDVRYLTRRFLAIVQHNMIEEERDVFPR